MKPTKHELDQTRQAMRQFAADVSEQTNYNDVKLWFRDDDGKLKPIEELKLKHTLPKE